MNDPENFLARWSRRKREIAAAEPEVLAPDTPAPPPAAELEAEMAALASPDETSAKSPANSVPAFDPASLPSLDSIGADTDIRGFLAPGVPTELAHAALRRVWTADPGIRDFKGLAEYDWDFTAPNSMFGFGDLDPGTDVKQMLADVLGGLKPEANPVPGNLSTEAQPPAASELEVSALSDVCDPEPETIFDETSTSERLVEQQQQDELLHRNANVAAQNSILSDDHDQSMPRRQHGGALPQ